MAALEGATLIAAVVAVVVDQRVQGHRAQRRQDLVRTPRWERTVDGAWFVVFVFS